MLINIVGDRSDMKSENPLEIFKAESPEVQKGFDALVQSLINDPGLDNKTKQLIYIAMKMVADDERAVSMHVVMAKKLGASRDEIKTTILLGLTVIGLKAAAKFLPLALESYDKS